MKKLYLKGKTVHPASLSPACPGSRGHKAAVLVSCSVDLSSFGDPFESCIAFMPCIQQVLNQCMLSRWRYALSHSP